MIDISNWAIDDNDPYKDSHSFIYQKMEIAQYLISKYFKNDNVIIDICSGTGLAAYPFVNAKEWSGNLYLIDTDTKAMDIARDKFKDIKNVEYSTSDAGDSNTYVNILKADMILLLATMSTFSIEDIENTVAFLPQICKTGSVLIWTKNFNKEIDNVLQDVLIDNNFEINNIVIKESINLFGGVAIYEGSEKNIIYDQRIFNAVF